MRRFLSQEAAKRFDDKLMGELGFATESLMELAGLSCAQCIFKEYIPDSVIVVCGPGNNGGDGLIAARHLFHFGFRPTVLYPKPTSNLVLTRLLTQCRVLGIPIVDQLDDYSSFSLIVDAIFGFSFRGDLREPFKTIIQKIKESGKPVVSLDIPSGWDVENGNITGEGLEPNVLISLGVPKLCATYFRGIHYIGGRFVPLSLAEEFQVDLPLYPGSDQIVRIN
ncbi:unnamed protein product [Blepharisma stoltei]|uniref:NAD(P)H-hydrate epimerase n=1 Tax=Blepharisma stoltei TaxID=1481888 RepID=A0AAU9JBN3_9CILI|nr:unnamed protein product [Blepharisma stoltei]